MLDEFNPEPSSEADHIIIVIEIGCVKATVRHAKSQEEEASGALLQEVRKIFASCTWQFFCGQSRWTYYVQDKVLEILCLLLVVNNSRVLLIEIYYSFAAEQVCS